MTLLRNWRVLLVMFALALLARYGLFGETPGPRTREAKRLLKVYAPDFEREPMEKTG